MALSAALTYGAIVAPEGTPIRTAFATIVIAVAASELVGPFLIRSLLRRTGEFEPVDEVALAGEPG